MNLVEREGEVEGSVIGEGMRRKRREGKKEVEGRK
jgi:hypothetical protein